MSFKDDFINKIVYGDCIEVMKILPDNSVDAIVTDPPYELGFMGKKWDNSGIAYNVEMWKECLRVLKHGGHLLSFGGSRTYHRMACAIEDAGFEIRDQIMWIYGSGFPKSLNIGKQIDNMQGNERDSEGIVKGHGSNSGESRYNWNSPDDKKDRRYYEKTIGDSEWEGWGTSLKPAHEPIVVARKPLSEKNVALNVLKHGTAGINIDGCRIGTDVHKVNVNDFSNIHSNKYGSGAEIKTKGYREQQGRFPANVILDEEAGKMLDEQSGTVTQGHWSKTTTKGFGEFGGGSSEYKGVGRKDKTKHGASRFFYCAKASKSERNKGLEMYNKKIECDRNPECYSADVPFNRSANPKKNIHPTVKPIDLMRYLVRLVTRPNGLVLDMFMGSGTTAIACKLEGMNYIGIEKEVEYVKIAEARIKAYDKQEKLNEV